MLNQRRRGTRRKAAPPTSARWTATGSSSRTALPVRKLRRVKRILELDDTVAEVRLRIRDRGVVDRRADLLAHEVEEQLGRQFAQLVLELLGEVAAKRRERFGPVFGGQLERHAMYEVVNDGQEQPSTYSTDGIMPAR